MIRGRKKILFLFFIIFSSCTNQPAVFERVDDLEQGSLPQPEDLTSAEGAEETPVFPPEPEPPEEYYITLVAVGDNLYHDVMIRQGKQGYDFEPVYSEIKPLVEEATIAFINQETLLAGSEFGYSGYPRFNTPGEVGDAVVAAGFDVINHATNHIMDKGEKAVTATMDFWDTHPETFILGIHRSSELRALPALIEKNSIVTGFLSYTCFTNGLPVPKDKPYLVSLADMEIMTREIDTLRPLCDFLVVSMHWGDEYSFVYNKQQKKLALFLADHQVDLVIGHHPHVLQPVEYIPRPDGKTMLCFYSLGNLISAQTKPATLLGAMAYVKVKKTIHRIDGIIENTRITEAGSIPLVTHYEEDFTGFKVYPLYAYTEELLDQHRLNQRKKELTREDFTNLSKEILGELELTKNPFDQSQF